MTTLLKMELLLCRFFRIRIQTTSTGLLPVEPSHYLIPRLYFCCMLIAAFYAPHTNLPLPHIQLNQYQLDLVSGLADHHSVCLLAEHFGRTSSLSLHSHAIDNEHST